VKIDRPGIYDVPAGDYHADPVGPAPSLSASIAHALLTYSPHHAAFQHPRLNPAYEPDHDATFDLGTAAHAYLLEGIDAFVIVEAKDWRTKAAKESRDAAYAAGKTPLLAARWADVQAMAEAARRQLAEHEAPIPFTNGRAEETLVWEEDGVWCRARLDWLHADHRTIDDLKTTEASANPILWTRGPLFAHGCDVQAAFYSRGVRAIFGLEPEFRFVVVEASPPYALSVVGLGPEAMALAGQKVARAIEMWRTCLGSGVFPGYPRRICWADLPPWESARWLEREFQGREVPADPAPYVDDGRDIAEVLFGKEA
jgi:hypothetical protein